MATRQQKIQRFEIVAIIVAVLALLGGIWYAFLTGGERVVPREELTTEELEERMTAPVTEVSKELIDEAIRQTSAQK